MRVYVINIENEEVDGPTNIRVNPGETVREFKMRLAKVLNMNINTLNVVKEAYSNDLNYLDDDDLPMKFDHNYTGPKIYVSNSLDEDPEKGFLNSKLQKVIDRFRNVINIDVYLPEVDAGWF